MKLIKLGWTPTAYQETGHLSSAGHRIILAVDLGAHEPLLCRQDLNGQQTWYRVQFVAE